MATPNATHICKWCGSTECDAVVLCDYCDGDISTQDTEYHYDPINMEADDGGYVRLCHKCKGEALKGR